MNNRNLFVTMYRYSLSFVILVAIIVLLKKSIISALCLIPVLVLIIPLLDKKIEERVPLLSKIVLRIFVCVLFFGFAIALYPNIMNSSDNFGSESNLSNNKEIKDKIISGINPSDIYLGFEQNGFITEKNIDAGGGIYTSKASTNGIDYIVETYSNSDNNVTSVTLTATRISPQSNKISDMKIFLKYGCSIPYDGSDVEEIGKWIEQNYFKDKATTTIAGVKFTIYCPTEFARMIEIEPVNETKNEMELDNSAFWNNYSSDVKLRIHKLIENKDCKGLQNEFNIADKNNQAQMNRTGRNNAELMDFIDNNMKKLGCYRN